MKIEQNETLSDPAKRTIFAALVELQDAGCPVRRSKADTAGRFSITEKQVLAVERQSLAEQWPPLT